MRAPDDDILFLLKTRGRQRAEDMARRLGVSRQAVRQKLDKLSAAGLVDSKTEVAGVGRPRKFWSLTSAGHGRFPDTHAQITVELIAAVREEFGADGVERLIARRERWTADAYGRALEGATGLNQKLQRLAALREAEGYMPEVRRRDDGSYLLFENHCPICAAAAACQGFCRSELSLFEGLLAPAKVERTEHILAGAARCAYRIVP